MAKPGVQPQHSRCLKVDTKQVPYSGPTNIRRGRTQSSRHGKLVSEICAPLA